MQNELKPLWPEAPRYCPELPLPFYRFVSGLHPHPTGNPKGHSFGKEKKHFSKETLYFFGIDLYHQGYLWESHEAWEELWQLTDRQSAEAQFLQGLIQNSAALLKVHTQQWNAARHLSHESWERLCVAYQTCPRFMGLDIAQFIQEMQNFYGELWLGKEITKGQAPRIELDMKK